MSRCPSGCEVDRAARDREELPHPPSSMNKIALLVAAAAALFATSVTAQQDIGKNAKVTLVFDQQLPNVPGKSLRVVLVEYGPDGGSPSKERSAAK